MSARKEAVGCFESNDGLILLNPNDIYDLAVCVEEARINYENKRRALLEHYHARFYGVVVFGSARLGPETREYKQTSALTKGLVEARNVDIVTGGGPGIMQAAHYGSRLAIEEAAARGVRLSAKNHSVRMEDLLEQSSDYSHMISNHRDFTTRIRELIDLSKAAYIASGGFGTDLELAMLIQEKQVGHLEPSYPIIIHPEVWREIMAKKTMAFYHGRVMGGEIPLINEEDQYLVTFTDDPQEVIRIISEDYDKWRREVRDRVRYVRPRKNG